MYFFSKSTNGFYLESVHGDGIPSDAVKVTSEDYAKLFQGQSQGDLIVADKDGNPVLQKRVPTQQEKISEELAWIVSEMDRAREELEKVQDSDPKAHGTVAQWRDYRKQLRALPEHPLFPSIDARPVAPNA